jgi:hypothetical protein
VSGKAFTEEALVYALDRIVEEGTKLAAVPVFGMDVEWAGIIAYDGEFWMYLLPTWARRFRGRPINNLTRRQKRELRARVPKRHVARSCFLDSSV